MCPSPDQPIIQLTDIILIIIALILAYLAFKAVDRKGGKMEYHNGICKTCQKKTRVNNDEQCFQCLNKEN